MSRLPPVHGRSQRGCFEDFFFQKTLIQSSGKKGRNCTLVNNSLSLAWDFFGAHQAPQVPILHSTGSGLVPRGVHLLGWCFLPFQLSRQQSRHSANALIQNLFSQKPDVFSVPPSQTTQCKELHPCPCLNITGKVIYIVGTGSPLKPTC